MSICQQCGKRLVDAVGRKVSGVERVIAGNSVRMHKVCAKRFDSERPLTATVPVTQKYQE